MQKKLIAAAVAGLIAVPALAQTNVTISGNFRAGWESYKITDCTTGFSCRNESRVTDQSSGLRFNVVEDLGGGLSAWGQLDYRGNIESGALGNSGNSGVGFMHKGWGKFTIGRWDVHYNEITGALQAPRASSLQALVGHGIISQVNGTMIANGTRTPNLMMWDSPNWNGFTARLAYSTGFDVATNEGSGRSTTGTGNPGGGSAWTGALRYNNGPWNAGVSYWNADGENRQAASPFVFSATTGLGVATPNTRNDQTSTRAWLGYTFGMGLKVGIAWDRSKRSANSLAAAATTMSRSGWMIPVTYSFGPHAIYGAYSRVGSHSGSAVAAGTGGQYKAHQYMLGYDYAFSKRTTAGVFYTKVNNNTLGSYDMFNGSMTANGGTSTSANEGSRQWYVGMNHSF